jgi:hypothetical protein
VQLDFVLPQLIAIATLIRKKGNFWLKFTFEYFPGDENHSSLIHSSPTSCPQNFTLENKQSNY